MKFDHLAPDHCPVIITTAIDRIFRGVLKNPNHRKNEVGLISFAFTGDSKGKLDLSRLNQSQTKLFLEVIAANQAMISMEVPYVDRKQLCRNRVYFDCLQKIQID
jgi:hypothetical protein